MVQPLKSFDCRAFDSIIKYLMMQQQQGQQDQPVNEVDGYERVAHFIKQVLSRVNGQHAVQFKERILPMLDRLPESLGQALDLILELIDVTIANIEVNNDYQAEIQKLEAKIRKHVKVQIELKLYYEHLQQKLEQETKKTAELERKLLRETFKQAEATTQLKFGSQVVSNDNSASNKDSNYNSRKNKDSTSRIRSKLSFHQMAEFTKRVEIRPFAEKTYAPKTINREPSNSLKNLRSSRDRSGHRKSDIEIIKQIAAAGRYGLNLKRDQSASRGSLQSNRRSISNSQLTRGEASHRLSRPNLK